MKRAKRRRAVTLTDVLASIITLTLLLTLLLPMMGCAQNNYSRTSCAVKLKQLATALHLYNDNMQTFPPSAFYKDGQNLGEKSFLLKSVVPGKGGATNDSAPYSFFVKLLPYIEQNYIYDNINFSKHEAFAPENFASAAKVIPVFLCPSYRGNSQSDAPDYAASTGTGRPALTNYKSLGATTLACLQDPKFVGMPDYNGGVLHPYAAYSLNNLKALSQTAILVETKEPKYAAWWDGTTASIPGFHPGTGNVADDRTSSPPVAVPALNVAASGAQKSFITPAQFGGKEDMQWGPSSDHPGLVQHALGGTESRAISNDIDPIVYSALVSRRADDNGPLINFFK